MKKIKLYKKILCIDNSLLHSVEYEFMNVRYLFKKIKGLKLKNNKIYNGYSTILSDLRHLKLKVSIMD